MEDNDSTGYSFSAEEYSFGRWQLFLVNDRLFLEVHSGNSFLVIPFWMRIIIRADSTLFLYLKND